MNRRAFFAELAGMVAAPFVRGLLEYDDMLAVHELSFDVLGG
jgi:hypothetical protein